MVPPLNCSENEDTTISPKTRHERDSNGKQTCTFSPGITTCVISSSFVDSLNE